MEEDGGGLVFSLSLLPVICLDLYTAEETIYKYT
jgi:hypothetical protein